MKMFKRFGLLILLNVLVMVTLSIILNIFNVQPYLNANGIQYSSLMVFCLIWGFGGAFISLLLSKFMAKMMMGVKIINPDQMNNPEAQWLVQTVHRLARNANIQKMPEVGIFESEEMNAFATGPRKNNSLVAVSSGLLGKMNQAEIEGVLAHEVAHIANGDMVTMTLIQGLVNAFGMFLSRVIGHFVSTFVEEKYAPIVRFVATLILDIVFQFLGMFIVSYVSRQREYRADKGGAGLAGSGKMISALQRLQHEMAPIPVEASPVQTMQISNRRKGLLRLLSTHPDLSDRIARLQQAA